MKHFFLISLAGGRSLVVSASNATEAKQLARTRALGVKSARRIAVRAN